VLVSQIGDKYFFVENLKNIRTDFHIKKGKKIYFSENLGTIGAISTFLSHVMIHNNFSDLYKKILINAEHHIRLKWYQQLYEIDVFFEILSTPCGKIEQILRDFWIGKELFEELQETFAFWDIPKDRRWVYSGMNTHLKDTILLSVKIASQNSKPRASLEDFLVALLHDKSAWLSKMLSFVGIAPQSFESAILDLNIHGFVDGQITEEKEPLDRIVEAITNSMLEESENGQNPWNPDFNGPDSFPPIGSWPFWPWPITPPNFWSQKPMQNQKTKNTSSKTPALDFFSTDLVELAKNKEIDSVIGRNIEVERLLSILNRKTKNNPVLVGEPWVGKTAIVEWLALRIANGDVPVSMREKRILSLDLTSMIAGTKYRGEFETRIKQIIEEASHIENEVILFIDEIHTIIGAGSSEGSLDASNILKPAMGRGKIRLIGATTLNEYQKYIEKDSALERRFQRITVDEPTPEDAVVIISGIKHSFEDYHNLTITDEAVVASVELSSRYITDKFLPDKAIDLIDEACSLQSMRQSDSKVTTQLKAKVAKLTRDMENFIISQQYEKASKLKQKIEDIEQEILNSKKYISIPKKERPLITPTDIQKVVSMSTGIPVNDLEASDFAKLKKLPELLKSYIIGQDRAVDAVSQAIIRSKVWIANPKKPLGSFLFLGPTGVGKTELVKVLAKEYYGSNDALIKIDMSEYSDKTGVSKLIGANAGYVWYEEWGQLTEKVRKKPYSIVLFDEIEKGDFEVYNLLLQILDEWVLTDNKGRKVNFKNTIIIMTSNIGQEVFNREASKIGFQVEKKDDKDPTKDFAKAEESIKNNLSDYFSPEFLNRIDKVIVFQPLTPKSIEKIVELHLNELVARLKELKNITLTYDKKIIKFIAKTVYNPEYGAREISRYLVEHIEHAIAKNLLYKKNYATMSLTLKKQEIVIE